MSSVQPVRSTALLRLLVGLAACTVLLPATAAAQTPGQANKSPVDMTVADPQGDTELLGVGYSQAERDTVDIVSATTHQNREASSLQATVTLAGAGPIAFNAQLRVAFGSVDASNDCRVTDFGGVFFLADLRPDHPHKAIYSLSTQQDVFADITMTENGNVYAFDSGVVPNVFDGRAWNCVRVSTEPYGNNRYNTFTDQATGYLPPPDPAPVAVPAPVKGGTAAILDADGDGIHDGVDKCPTVAGAATTGCETTPAAKSIKLGTKRVVIDRLLTKTGTTCPVKVTVIVTMSGHRIGKQPMGATMHGKFCQVVGVAKLKKRASKVKVVIKGTGVSAVSVNVKK